ncbi:MAG: FAD:protein FMN transferase [Pseudomonadota bacterium]
MIRLAAILLLSLLAACDSTEETIYHDQFIAFGTLIELSISGISTERGARVAGEIERQFQRWHRDWHAWEPGLLTQTNAQLATLQPFTLDPALRPLVTEANRLSRLSDGLFNPVLGKLIAIWGFQGNPLPAGVQPDPAAIKHWLANAPTVEDIDIEGSRIVSHNPQAAYDLGGFAKGYAVDRVIELLRGQGIENAIINAGGDLRAIGTHGNRPWRIGIRHPRREGILASIDSSGDTSIFTSGDYERLFEVDGQRFHHILDPRTGYPARGTSAVTVVYSSGAVADAAATALFVAGPHDWLRIARQMGIDRAMLVDSDGAIHMTPAMQAITRLAPDVDAEVLISGE